MPNDTVIAKGNLQIIHYDGDGNIKESRQLPNTVVAVGKNYITSRMVGNTIAVMSHMAVGSSNTATVSTNTALGSEITRVAFDSATVSGNTATYTATYPAGTGTGTLREAGIFNSSDNGTMLCRTTFADFVKASPDAIVIIWNVNIQ